MPRISRNNITSKYIHVITQGIKKEYIFKNDEYKKEYTKLLNKITREFESTKILAYCIMDNHAHLLIYTDEIEELSKIMSRVNTSYGIFYNNHTNRVGYVFRNRYYTQQILDEKHLFNTLVYIHKNPVKAKMVEKYFYFIHKNFSEENIIDVKEEQEKSEQKMKNIITQFCDEHNWNLNYIKKDNYLLSLLVKEIKNNSDATNKMISEYIEIGKNRISNLTKIIRNN